MAHEFEVREEITLDATPEQVWQAIATGPGIDSWFMGRNEIQPGEGGRTKTTLLGHTEEATVTAWEPNRRFALRSDTGEDSTFMAFEYIIEGRGQGSTVLRFVHNGLLGGDWEAEFDALSVGDRMYLRKLAAYLKHFPGRTASFSIFAVGPQVADKDQVQAAFAHTFGLTGPAKEGDPMRLTADSLPAADGVVEFVSPSFLLARTDDGLYALIHGHENSIVAEHHNFSADLDEAATEQAWQNWLSRSFA